MKQRISAGGIAFQNGKVLLVHHYRPGSFDFWVMPGDGIEGDEGILNAAEREVFEETNLNIHAEWIAYIEEFIDEDKYVCKFWVLCNLESGELAIINSDDNEAFLKSVGFFSRAEV